ncbi:MAG: DUF3696 domain-containing protein [Chloroflexales bacterium]|nr:DUF3696 domain-containing protein [Chloroflexales bacterium]
MITRLQIQNFKCFRDQEFPLRPLTLLAGANASGKSSAIQALLLLRQSHLAGVLLRGELLLNGPLASVGTALDALNEQSLEDIISFVLTYDDERQDTFAFAYERGAGDSYRLQSNNDIRYRRTYSPFDLKFNYLNAERVGPRLLYPMSEMRHDSIDLGVQGEHTAYQLARHGQERLRNQRLIYQNRATGEIQTSLLYQTRYWMRQIIDDIDINVEQVTAADQVRVMLRIGTSEYVRPTNIGFGIIYSLPIIVAALIAPKGGLLIVENPEAHLHPASQSRIGQFLAQVAATGMQVIIETHSDHVLNGIRRAVHGGLLAPDQVSILFFGSNARSATQVINPKIYPSGGIDPWPSGFFDQIEKDLMDLF